MRRQAVAGTIGPPTPRRPLSMAEQFRAAPFFFEAMKEDYVSRFHGDDAKEWIDPRDVGTELEQMKVRIRRQSAKALLMP